MEMFSLTCLFSVLLAHGNPGKKRIFYFFAINSLSPISLHYPSLLIWSFLPHSV